MSAEMDGLSNKMNCSDQQERASSNLNESTGKHEDGDSSMQELVDRIWDGDKDRHKTGRGSLLNLSRERANSIADIDAEALPRVQQERLREEEFSPGRDNKTRRTDIDTMSRSIRELLAMLNNKDSTKKDLVIQAKILRSQIDIFRRGRDLEKEAVTLWRAERDEAVKVAKAAQNEMNEARMELEELRTAQRNQPNPGTGDASHGLCVKCRERVEEEERNRPMTEKEILEALGKELTFQELTRVTRNKWPERAYKTYGR